MSGDALTCHNWEEFLVFSGWKTEVWKHSTEHRSNDLISHVTNSEAELD